MSHAVSSLAFSRALTSARLLRGRGCVFRPAVPHPRRVVPRSPLAPSRSVPDPIPIPDSRVARASGSRPARARASGPRSARTARTTASWTTPWCIARASCPPASRPSARRRARPGDRGTGSAALTDAGIHGSSLVAASRRLRRTNKKRKERQRNDSYDRVGLRRVSKALLPSRRARSRREGRRSASVRLAYVPARAQAWLAALETSAAFEIRFEDLGRNPPTYRTRSWKARTSRNRSSRRCPC